MKIILLLLTLLITLKSYGKTKNAWIQSKPGKLESGGCFEIDDQIDPSLYVQSEVFKYAKKVSDKKCLPPNTSYYFNFELGKCFEGDTETNGQNYYDKTELEHCKPDKVSYAVLKLGRNPKCYEIDDLTKGQSYYKKVNGSFCKNTDLIAHVWEPKNQFSGKCYVIDSRTGSKAKTNSNVCRPTNFGYSFVRQGPFKGTCVEHSMDPDNLYSIKTKILNCRPTSTVFIFYKPEGESKGKCFEMDEETKGDKYLKVVGIHNCKED